MYNTTHSQTRKTHNRRTTWDTNRVLTEKPKTQVMVQRGRGHSLTV